MIRSPPQIAADRRPAARRRRAALLAALLLLAACEPGTGTEIRFAASLPPQTAPAAGSVPRFAGGDFIAEDGARLPLRQWLPGGLPGGSPGGPPQAGGVKAVILALHGFGDYSHAFATPAPLWAAQGIATYAFDQRGFGAAPGHGSWAGEGRLAADAIEASRILRQLYPGRPLYLLGESMGGAIAILAMTGAMPGTMPGTMTGTMRQTADPSGPPVAAADGLILAAPAVWGRATMDLIPRLTLFVAARLFPDMILTGRDLHIMASDNLPMLRALARDPLVLKGARVDMVYGLVDLMDEALAAAPRLAAPTLLMYGAHDEVVPREPIAAFVAHLPAGPADRRRLAFYARGYHLLLRDLEGAAVARDVASWILDRGAPLPSHADAGAAARPWPPGDSRAAVTVAPPAAAVDARPELAPGLALDGARR